MDKGDAILGSEGQEQQGSADQEQQQATSGQEQQAASGQEQQQEAKPWYSGLPQEMHDKFKEMSAEDAAKVFERGSAYKPAASIDEIQLETVEGLPINDDTVSGFKTFAVENGMTAEQAKKAFDFYKAEDARLTNEAISENKAALRETWKTDQEFKENVALAEKAVAFYDGKIGGIKAAVGAGLHSNAPFIKLMAHLGKAISEADVSGGGNGTGDVAMTPEEFYGQYHPKTDS